MVFDNDLKFIHFGRSGNIGLINKVYIPPPFFTYNNVIISEHTVYITLYIKNVCLCHKKIIAFEDWQLQVKSWTKIPDLK